MSCTCLAHLWHVSDTLLNKPDIFVGKFGPPWYGSLQLLVIPTDEELAIAKQTLQVVEGLKNNNVKME